MGCTHCKEIPEIGTHEDQPMINILNDHGFISLSKGGIIVQTSAGNIQFGIPPETVKDSMMLGLDVPEYFIIPKEVFDWSDGISLMEFEFPIYYNFFLRKQTKTKLLCSASIENRVRIIFQETLIGPKDLLESDADYIDGYTAKADLRKELDHFAKNPFLPGELYKIDQFIEFIRFDENSPVSLDSKSEEDKSVKVKIQLKSNMVKVYENETLISSFENKAHLISNNFFVFKSIGEEIITEFVPPVFGMTVLGSSHGFDCKGSTSGFIIWINREGVMIDPPPYSSRVLRNQGIQPSFIKKIIISHCHADHDAGSIHKIIEADSVEFISTMTIMSSFLRKFSAITDLTTSEISKLFQYRTVKIGQPYYLLGAKFVFFYSFHSIPTLGFQVSFKGKSFYFSGDTFYDPPKLEELFKAGVLSEERYKFLANPPLETFDVIFHEAGIPPIHTPARIFFSFPDEIKEKLYLIHIAEKDIPKDQGLKGVPLGLRNTIRVLDQDSEEDAMSSKLDLLCCLDLINWIPFSRIPEVLHCFKESKIAEGEVLFKEGDHGEDFYVVKDGLLRISSNGANGFSKNCYRGDYFGESCLNGTLVRMAQVEALTNSTVLRINRHDFKWIFSYDSKEYPDKPQPLDLLRNLQIIRQSHFGEFLNKNSEFAKMTESQKNLLNMFMKEEEVGGGVLVAKRDEVPRFAIILKEGKVEVKSANENTQDIILSKSACFIGDFDALLSQKISNVQIRTVVPSTIFKISQKHLRIFLDLYPGFFLSLRDKTYVY